MRAPQSVILSETTVRVLLLAFKLCVRFRAMYNRWIVTLTYLLRLSSRKTVSFYTKKNSRVVFTGSHLSAYNVEYLFYIRLKPNG